MTAPTVEDTPVEIPGYIVAAYAAVMAARPVETDINVDLVPTDAEPIVRLQFATPQGVNIFYVSQTVARRIGVDLQKIGSERKLAVVGRAA